MTDRFTEERYGVLTFDDLDEERWPWRGRKATNTAVEIARRRRDLWLAMGSEDDGETPAA